MFRSGRGVTGGPSRRAMQAMLPSSSLARAPSNVLRPRAVQQCPRAVQQALAVQQRPTVPLCSSLVRPSRGLKKKFG